MRRSNLLARPSLIRLARQFSSEVADVSLARITNRDMIQRLRITAARDCDLISASNACCEECEAALRIRNESRLRNRCRSSIITEDAGQIPIALSSDFDGRSSRYRNSARCGEGCAVVYG